MPQIEWNDSIKIGVVDIDEQHRNLVKLINAVEQIKSKGGMDKNANKLTYTLQSFARHHFHTEETLMRRHGYPDFQIHKDEHERILGEIDQLHARTESGDDVNYYQVYDFLRVWFLGHTSKYDKKYVKFFEEKGVARTTTKNGEPVRKLIPGQKKLIDWAPAYDFGVDDIDRQHRAFVDAINELYHTIGKPNKKTAVENAFKELGKYSTQHFNREEGLMESCNYPDCIYHGMEHANFKRQLNEIKTKYEKYKTVVDHDLVMTLKNWFMTHTQVEDRKYLEHVNSEKNEE